MCCVEAQSPLPWGYILLFQSVLLQRAVFSGSHESRCYWSGKLTRMARIDRNILSRENNKCLSVSFSSSVRRKAVLPPSLSPLRASFDSPRASERLSFLPNAPCSLQLAQQRLRVELLVVSHCRGITETLRGTRARAKGRKEEVGASGVWIHVVYWAWWWWVSGWTWWS